MRVAFICWYKFKTECKGLSIAKRTKKTNLLVLKKRHYSNKKTPKTLIITIIKKSKNHQNKPIIRFLFFNHELFIGHFFPFFLKK